MNRTPDLRCFTTEPHIDFADLSCMQDACHMTVCGSVVEYRGAESGIRNPESGIWNLRFDSSWELIVNNLCKTYFFAGSKQSSTFLRPRFMQIDVLKFTHFELVYIVVLFLTLCTAA